MASHMVFGKGYIVKWKIALCCRTSNLQLHVCNIIGTEASINCVPSRNANSVSTGAGGVRLLIKTVKLKANQGCSRDLLKV